MIRSAKAKERNLNTPLWPGNYRVGMWIWLLQRISGLVLVFYVFMHLIVISSSIAGAEGKGFDEAMAFLENPIFIAGEILLFAPVLYHALNGIRILLFDMGVGVRHQKELAIAVVVVAFVLWAIGAYMLLPLVLGQAWT